MKVISFRLFPNLGGIKVSIDICRRAFRWAPRDALLPSRAKVAVAAYSRGLQDDGG